MSNMYLSGLQAILNKEIDFDTDDIRCLLVSSSYTFAETHDFVSDITNELSGGNYARQQIATRSFTEDAGNHWIKCDGADTTFASLEAVAGTPATAIVYLYNAADAAARLICACPLTTPPTPNGGDYKIVWGTNGIFTVGN